MLQQDKPDDFVIATGETHSVREFVNLAFQYAGIELEWTGKGVEEKGMIKSFSLTSALTSTLTSTLTLTSNSSLSLASTLSIGDAIVEIDSRYLRPTEVEYLLGDATKAKKKLGWEPKVKFKDLVKMMVDADLKALEEMKQSQDVIRKLSNNKK